MNEFEIRENLRHRWDDLKTRVDNWAKTNAFDDFWYGSPYSYWRLAFEAGIITQDQYDLAKRMYGNMWNYRGD